MTLAVIGAGFGRTGTLSLKDALERLGLGPCYHMIEVFQDPAHIEVWNRAADGGRVDWEAELFRGYRAAVDWPACHFCRELADLYPEAKVVLTVRDPDRWYRSACETIFPVITEPVPEHDPVMRALAGMARKIVLDQAFGGRIDDRDHAVAVFNRHIEAVRRTIPPERLLVYEVADGWEPLCRFLGVPVPDEPFPRANSTDEFQRLMAARSAAASP